MKEKGRESKIEKGKKRQMFNAGMERETGGQRKGERDFRCREGRGRRKEKYRWKGRRRKGMRQGKKRWGGRKREGDRKRRRQRDRL